MESTNDDWIVGSWVVSVSGPRDCIVISLDGHMLVKYGLLDAY